jgi:hypothetical protein
MSHHYQTTHTRFSYVSLPSVLASASTLPASISSKTIHHRRPSASCSFWDPFRILLLIRNLYLINAIN